MQSNELDMLANFISRLNGISLVKETEQLSKTLIITILESQITMVRTVSYKIQESVSCFSSFRTWLHAKTLKFAKLKQLEILN